MGTTDIMSGGDVVVIGAGLAGAFAVRKLAGLNVTWIATRGAGDEGSSAYAQGGIAVALGSDDTPELHLADTLAAGAGIVDLDAARNLVTRGPELVRELASLGVPFDRTETGEIALGREAAHSRRRIAHAGGDRTGAQVMRTLAPIAAAQAGVTLVSNTIAESLILSDGGIAGVLARRNGAPVLISAPNILLATGGIGALYRVTTNPLDSTGDGLGMAARAGALIADPEFVQFHPTGLDVDRDPAPLASEALRGEGATLINQHGARFCFDHHADGELAPRDVVARAIWAEIGKGNQVFLDTRACLGASIETRFPTIFDAAMASGIDARIQPLPVAPAAHYHMGGIAVDQFGATSIPGLWAAGEVACTGVHGANRLASNSLLEALVTGDAAAAAIKDQIGKRRARMTARPVILPAFDPAIVPRLRAIMSEAGGGLRSADTITRGLDALAHIEAESVPSARLANRLAVMRLVLFGALMRQESRGAHARQDFSQTDPVGKRTYLHLNDVAAFAVQPRRRAGAR
jgi:L-aspartate oxidase